MSAGGGLRYDRYSTGGGEEWLMRLGPADGAPILFLPPLFEEMNRTRALIAAIMRDLAGRGHCCWLPDLPGTGESSRALEDCSWSDWRTAVSDAFEHISGAAPQRPLLASFRGGALLDHAADADCRWRFAPVEGASLARDMIRSSMLKPGETEDPFVDLAGYRLNANLLADLTTAKLDTSGQVRTVRLQSDRNEADGKLEGPALWRRSEPANSPELASLSASDISELARQCAAS